MSPIVSRLQRQGYAIRTVDVDRNAALAQRYGITSIPAFVLIVNGQERTRYVGSMSEHQLRRLAMQIPSGPSRPTQVAVAASRANPASVAVTSPETPASSKAAVPKSTALPRTDTASDHEETAKAEQPKSRIHFPFFGRKKTETAPAALASAGSAATSTPPIIRAKYDNQNSIARNQPADRPLASCTRIRVKDSAGINYGSGTIIDSRAGRTLVLTCGHIFREFAKNSIIEVDVFVAGRSETFVGELLQFDLDADVGLLAIPTAEPLAMSAVALRNSALVQGQLVFSIGCGGGERPSKQQHRVTAINRYLGPDNIECTGVPVRGRSGGGLFNSAGQVVGVCFAADERDQRGLYVGLPAIHNLLKRSGYSHLYRSSPGHDEATPPTPPTPIAREAFESSPPFAEQQSPPFAEAPHVVATSTRTANPGSNSQAADIARIRSALAKPGESEVVCIVRPLGNPRAVSRVVIINRASAKFVADLTSEVEAQAKPTSKVVPYPRSSGRSPASAAVIPVSTPASSVQRYRRSAASRSIRSH